MLATTLFLTLSLINHSLSYPFSNKPLSLFLTLSLIISKATSRCLARSSFTGFEAALLCSTWKALSSGSLFSGLTTFSASASIIKSSIRSGVKFLLPVLHGKCRWIVGNVPKISFWRDGWPITSLVGIQDDMDLSLNSMVSDSIVNGRWSLPRL